MMKKDKKSLFNYQISQWLLKGDLGDVLNPFINACEKEGETYIIKRCNKRKKYAVFTRGDLRQKPPYTTYTFEGERGFCNARKIFKSLKKMR
jgi:hypothetical protein